LEFLTPVYNNPPYTICTWVKPESLPTNDNWYIISNGAETSHSYGFSIYVYNSTSSPTSYRFSSKRSDAKGNSLDYLLNNNEWIYLCGTWDGSLNQDSIKFYVNGEIIGMATPIEKIVNGPERNLIIGKDTDGWGSDDTGHYFDGIIDEVRIYNRVLNQDEIYDLMSYNNHMKPSANFSIRQTNDPSIIEINYVSNRNMSEIKWDFNNDKKWDEIYYNKKNITLYKKYTKSGVYNISLYVNNSNMFNISCKEIAVLLEYNIKKSNNGFFISYPYPISLHIEPLINKYYLICPPQIFDHVSFTLDFESYTSNSPIQIENQDVWQTSINLNEGHYDSYVEIEGFNSNNNKIWYKRIKPNIVFTPDWFKTFLVASDLISDIQVENDDNFHHWSMNIVPAYMGLGYNISNVPIEFIGGKYGINASISAMDNILLDSNSFDSKYYPLFSLNVPLWEDNTSWSRPFDFGTFQKAEWYSNIIFNASAGFLINKDEISCIGYLRLFGAAGVKFDIPVYVIPFISEAGLTGGIDTSIDTKFIVCYIGEDGYTLCPDGLSDSIISLKGNAGIYADMLCGFARLEGGLEAFGKLKISLPSLNKELNLYGGAYAKLSALWGFWSDEWKYGFNINIVNDSYRKDCFRLKEISTNRTPNLSFDLLCLHDFKNNRDNLLDDTRTVLSNNVVEKSDPNIESISQNKGISVWNDIIRLDNNSFQSDIFWSYYNKTWSLSNQFNTPSICEYNPYLCKVGNDLSSKQLFLGYLSVDNVVDQNSSIRSFYTNATINGRIWLNSSEWSKDNVIINNTYGTIKNYDVSCPNNSTIYISYVTGDNNHPTNNSNCRLYINKNSIINNSFVNKYSILLLKNITIEKDSIFIPKMVFYSKKIGCIIYNIYKKSTNKYELNMFATRDGLNYTHINLFKNISKIQSISCTKIKNNIAVCWILNHSKIYFKLFQPNSDITPENWIFCNNTIIFEDNTINDLQIYNCNNSLILIYKKGPSFANWFINYNIDDNNISKPYQFFSKSTSIIDQIDLYSINNTSNLIYSLKKPMSTFLMGYWPLNEEEGYNVSDHSINNYNGIIEKINQNDEDFLWKNHTGINQNLSIEYGNYIQFLNNSCKIKINNNFSLNSYNDLSISFWFKLEDTSSYDEFIRNNGSFIIFQQFGYLQVKLWKNNDLIELSNISIVPLDSWIFVSFRISNESVKVWIYDIENNIIKKQYSLERGYMNISDTPIYLGGFMGCLDEIRIYDQYLTDGMVESLWFSPYSRLDGIFQIITHRLPSYTTIEALCANSTDDYSTNDIISFCGSNPYLNYEWDFNDGTVLFGNCVSHRFSKPGYYTIYCNATDPDSKIKTYLVKQMYITDRSAPRFKGIKTISAGNNSVYLSWDAAIDENLDLTYYCFIRTNNEEFDFNHPNLITTNTSLCIDNLVANITYYFIVRAIDCNGNIENNKLEKSAIPYDKQSPSFYGLKNIGILFPASHKIFLEWDHAFDISTPIRYNIYMSNDSNNFDFNNSVLLTTNSFCSLYNVTNGEWFFIVRSTDFCGNEDDNEHQLSINVSEPNYIANFSYYPPIPAAGFLVYFYDSSVDIFGQIINWTWNVDNELYFDKNISYIFDSIGNHSINLTVINNHDVIRYINKTITVYPPDLKANFTYFPQYPTINNYVQFNDTSISSHTIINWSWDFGDGSTSFIKNPIHQFNNNETYNVSLSIINKYNISNTIAKYITIYNGLEECIINQSVFNRGFPIRKASDGKWSAAQDFSISTKILDQIEILIRKFGSPEFDLIIQLRKNCINGTLLDQLYFSSDNISSSWSWLNLNFTNCQINDNESYFIVCSPPPSSVSTSFGYEWGYRFGNSYDEGSFWFTRDGGMLWRDLPELYEFAFKVYSFN